MLLFYFLNYSFFCATFDRSLWGCGEEKKKREKERERERERDYVVIPRSNNIHVASADVKQDEKK